MNIDVSNKRVIVQGADGELERALIRAFEASDARVKGQLDLHAGSQNQSEAHRAALDANVEALGGLDILVSTVGVRSRATLEEASLDTWDAGFSRPLKSAFFTLQAALPALKDSRGAIVNVTSILGQMGAPRGLAIAGAAMACLVHHTRMMAPRLSCDQVRVNCVCHGFLSEAERAGVSAEQSAESTFTKIPMGRLTTPNDIVGSVLLLASPLASYTTGAVLSADGGTFAGN